MTSLQQKIIENPTQVLVALSNVFPEFFESTDIENGHSDESPKIIDLEKQTEIVDGKVEIKKPSGLRASGIATRIAVKLGIYLKTNNIGRLYGADATFTTVNENERMADVALVFNDKLQEGEPISKASFAPDLAVEVISPTDMNSKVVKKVREYFAAGVRRVWLVEPELETVTVYLSLNHTRIFYKNEDLIDEEILPNFRLPLKDIFLA